MELKGFWKRYENEILASALLAVLLLLIGMRYDYYYDMNDDVMIKDILSGVYTGTPEGHNIQLLYPLSFLLSLFYRLFPNAPVYGIFLCLCQYGSLWLVVYRSLCMGGNTWIKAGITVTEGVVSAALLLPHLVFVQYTFVSGMLTAAAAFLFITSKKEDTGAFIRHNMLSVFLAVLAYMLRTEMLLLLLPLVCVAGVYRWSLEEKIFTKDNAVKYLAVIGGILAGMLAAWGINAAAFAGPEWQEYVGFFNSRTELYDFQGIPPYEGNEELYGSLGMSRSGQDMLLEQYNFGLEEELDAEDLDKISEFQVRRSGEKQSFLSLFAEKLRLYRYRSLHKEPGGSGIPDDYPWNLLALAGYAAVFGMMTGSALLRRKFRRIAAGTGTLLFLFGVRTSLWMFLLMRGRDPERVTHSLYLMEICILFAILHTEAAALGLKSELVFLFMAVLALASAAADRNCITETDREYQARTAANMVDREMKAYCREHGENFYFFDVYSAVSYPLEPYASTYYSEKMFAEVDNRLGNYDIMGGWLVKSPSYRKKLEVFGITSMRDALLYQENVYMMAELTKGTESFEAYFSEYSEAAELELADTICDIIGVYRVRTADRQVQGKAWLRICGK